MEIVTLTIKKDKIGQVLNIDDIVVFPMGHGTAIRIGRVIKIHNKMITVKEVNSTLEKRVYPVDTVKIDSEYVMIYLLGNTK